MEHRNDASSLRRSTHTSDAQLHRALCDILRMAEAEPPPLRHWLVHNARLDHRIIDRTIEELSKEDVFTVADLAVLRGTLRWLEMSTAVSRAKMAHALDNDALPLKPLGIDIDTAPDWLAEAGAALLKIDDGLGHKVGTIGESAARKKGDESAARPFQLQLPAVGDATSQVLQRPLRTDLALDDDDDEVDGGSSTRSSRSRKRSSRRHRRSQSARAPQHRGEDDTLTFSTAALAATARSAPSAAAALLAAGRAAPAAQSDQVPGVDAGGDAEAPSSRSKSSRRRARQRQARSQSPRRHGEQRARSFSPRRGEPIGELELLVPTSVASRGRGRQVGRSEVDAWRRESTLERHVESGGKPGEERGRERRRSHRGGAQGGGGHGDGGSGRRGRSPRRGEQREVVDVR